MASYNFHLPLLWLQAVLMATINDLCYVIYPFWLHTRSPREGMIGSQNSLSVYSELRVSLWVSSLTYLVLSKPGGEPRSSFRTRTGGSVSQASSDPGDILGD